MYHIDQYNYGDRVAFRPCCLEAAKWMKAKFAGPNRQSRIVFKLPAEKWAAFDFRKAAGDAGFGIKIHLF